jgi:hypothetical protein
MTLLVQSLRGLLVASASLLVLAGLPPAEAAKNAVRNASAAKATAAKPTVQRPVPPRPASAPADRSDAHWRHHGVG